ncbi:MAG: MFS transporter [Chroococcidiopsidaceae cyanobacterium CP_BM_ER_R8_30]|nr:MFS transporter [Chroococcidiopsidaceae cyanobacterium CP_BM_ER_R8_30]
MQRKAVFRSPWAFVPTLYFAEGVPYVIINIVSIIFYKKMGINNAQITLWTSLLYLPWVIKMFWSPIIDTYSTKRSWILCTQIAMMVCLSCVALSFQISSFFVISLTCLTIGAFISATHDIATDGFYLIALNQEKQAFFAGIRSFFYRVAMIFGSGFLVFFAGQLEVSLENNISLSWTIAIGFSALIFALLFVFHWLILPFAEKDLKQLQKLEIEKTHFLPAFTSYFSQKKIGAVIAFILLYRFGEAMLTKLATPFLIDKKELGGLGLSTKDVGLAYGTLGVIALILGGVLGGLLIARYGLRKSIWPMALAIHLPNLFYIYMAYTQLSKEWVYLLVALEQFGYGLGFTAFSVYLMYISRGEYKTSHFAISTGLMALGMMLPGLISGYIQQVVGYPVFFILVFLLTIPGLLTLFFIPLDEEQKLIV